MKTVAQLIINIILPMGAMTFVFVSLSDWECTLLTYLIGGIIIYLIRKS